MISNMIGPEFPRSFHFGYVVPPAIVSWLSQKVFHIGYVVSPAWFSSIVSWLRASIVSSLTQRLLDRIVALAESLSHWLRGLTCMVFLDRVVTAGAAGAFLQHFCNFGRLRVHFCNIFATSDAFLQHFCNLGCIFATFLQHFCNIFAAYRSVPGACRSVPGACRSVPGACRSVPGALQESYCVQERCRSVTVSRSVAGALQELDRYVAGALQELERLQERRCCTRRRVNPGQQRCNSVKERCRSVARAGTLRSRSVAGAGTLRGRSTADASRRSRKILGGSRGQTIIIDIYIYIYIGTVHRWTFSIWWPFQCKQHNFVYDILDILTFPMQRILFCIWYIWYVDLSNAKNIILYMIFLIFWLFQCKKPYFVYDILDLLIVPMQ